MNKRNLLYRGRDYKVTEYISVREPTIGEIFDFGEERYYSLLSFFVSTPFDMIAQLDSIGVDFTKITAYQMFCSFVTQLPQSESAILFGDTDFRKFRQIADKQGNMLLQDNKSFISEPIYILISDYLRIMNNLSPPKYKKVGNEFTKKKLIEYAYDDLKHPKKRNSQLLNYISFYTADSDNGYQTVWDMPIYAFFDTIKRKSAVKHTEILYHGMYSGNVDISKINKKELDFMRNLDK